MCTVQFRPGEMVYVIVYRSGRRHGWTRQGNGRRAAMRIGRGREGSKDCIGDTACSTRCGTRVTMQAEKRIHPHRASRRACATPGIGPCKIKPSSPTFLLDLSVYTGAITSSRSFKKMTFEFETVQRSHSRNV